MVDQVKNVSADTVLVGFDLDVEEEGWPPISTEILQALPLGDNKVQIDNTPFFVTSIALGDVIKVYKLEGEKYFRCDKLVQESGNYALSIILRKHQSRNTVVQLLSGENCFYEYGEFGHTKMYAVSINSMAKFTSIKAQLEELEAKEMISYAELCLA